jgi:hypothetical protein
MKHPTKNLFTAFLAMACATSFAQLRLDEPVDYPDGELTTVSFELWRAGSSPWAVVDNGAILVDHTEGRTFNGRYQRLWPSPASEAQVYASFELTVESAPLEAAGFNFVAVTNPTGEWNRARLFMKRGRDANSFRLGVSSSSAEYTNAAFFNADLLLNETYTITIGWDNVNLAARLYVDAPNDESAYRVEVTGGTPRNDGFRRFSIYMNSDHHLGRYRIDNIRAGEDWASVWQPFSDKPAPVVDPETALLFEDTFDYPNGELNAVSSNLWRLTPSDSNPYAEVQDGAMVVDHTQGRVFAGDYTRLWPVPDNPDEVYASFRLRVTHAPGETEGYNFVGFADRVSPEFQRSRIFMKKGEAEGTFRLGLSLSSALVSDDDGQNAFFIERDLQLGADHLVLLSWDAVNFVARLYLDTDDVNAPAISLTGDSTREIRRFVVLTDSALDLGRYEIRDLLVAEDWETVLQEFGAPFEPGFYDDPVLGRHYQFGSGWVWWAGESGDPDRGILKVDLREADGTGWIHHANHGWLYLAAGSADDGLFAYALDLGWIYTGEPLPGGWFHVFNTGAALRWAP